MAGSPLPGLFASAVAVVLKRKRAASEPSSIYDIAQDFASGLLPRSPLADLVLEEGRIPRYCSNTVRESVSECLTFLEADESARLVHEILQNYSDHASDLAKKVRQIIL